MSEYRAGTFEDELWSRVRDILFRGADIQMDYRSRYYETYDQYSNAMSRAAAEEMVRLMNLFRDRPVSKQPNQKEVE